MRWRRGRRPERNEIVNLDRRSIQVRVRGRIATVRGELLVRTRIEPDFIAYREQVAWDDDTPISEDEREEILRVLQDSARDQRIAIEVV
jgi:Immunity protein 74